MIFITASHDETILKNNLRKSGVDLIVQRDYDNISKAYNEATIPGQLNCYVHHDVVLPWGWLKSAYEQIKRLPDDWGVVGVAGVKIKNGKKENYGNILDRRIPWKFNVEKLPCETQTIDELLIITKGDVVFDERLDFDFYGADACLQMAEQNRGTYVINAFCEHNSGRAFGGRTESFYKCEDIFRSKWGDRLPVVTTCSLIEN